MCQVLSVTSVVGSHGNHCLMPTLLAADTCGEKLAWFFGITSPKYQYAIDEYKRLAAEVCNMVNTSTFIFATS